MVYLKTERRETIYFVHFGVSKLKEIGNFIKPDTVIVELESALNDAPARDSWILYSLHVLYMYISY